MKKYKYELTEEEAFYLLQMINKVNITGEQAAKSLLHMINILKVPFKKDIEKKDISK